MMQIDITHKILRKVTAYIPYNVAKKKSKVRCMSMKWITFAMWYSSSWVFKNWNKILKDQDFSWHF